MEKQVKIEVEIGWSAMTQSWLKQLMGRDEFIIFIFFGLNFRVMAAAGYLLKGFGCGCQGLHLGGIIACGGLNSSESKGRKEGSSLSGGRQRNFSRNLVCHGGRWVFTEGRWQQLSRGDRSDLQQAVGVKMQGKTDRREERAGKEADKLLSTLCLK